MSIVDYWGKQSAWLASRRDEKMTTYSKTLKKFGKKEGSQRKRASGMTDRCRMAPKTFARSTAIANRARSTKFTGNDCQFLVMIRVLYTNLPFHRYYFVSTPYISTPLFLPEHRVHGEVRPATVDQTCIIDVVIIEVGHSSDGILSFDARRDRAPKSGQHLVGFLQMYVRGHRPVHGGRKRETHDMSRSRGLLRQGNEKAKRVSFCGGRVCPLEGGEPRDRGRYYCVSQKVEKVRHTNTKRQNRVQIYVVEEQLRPTKRWGGIVGEAGREVSREYHSHTRRNLLHGDTCETRRTGLIKMISHRRLGNASPDMVCRRAAPRPRPLAVLLALLLFLPAAAAVPCNPISPVCPVRPSARKG